MKTILTILTIVGMLPAFASEAVVTNPVVTTPVLAVGSTNDSSKLAKEYLSTTTIDPETRELKPHDVLRFQIDQDPPVPIGGEPTRVSVSDGGEAMFPVSRHGNSYVKVAVAGKKLADLRKEVKILLDTDYYNDCSVQLDLEQVNRNGSFGDSFGSVTIYGELSGVIPIPDNKPLMLSDAILKAGKNDFADLKRVRIHRVDPQTKRDIVTTVNVTKILKEGNRDEDQQLKDGDRIEVREKNSLNPFN
jgi:protein involved in polysaccharide export with SLBB domain